MNISRRGFLGGLLALGASSPAVKELLDRPETARLLSSTLEQSSGGNRLVFGVPAPPLVTDPALATDSESVRLTRQVYDNLFGIAPDTGEPTARIATEWSVSDDGLVYNFTLRDDLKFHDGEALTAEIVAQNFQRWATLPALFERAGAADIPVLPFEVVFGGYADQEATLFIAARALSETRFQLELSAPIPGLVAALTDPAFAITSPRGWESFDAEFIAGYDGSSAQRVRTPLAGTGPFRWVSPTESDYTVELERVPATEATDGEQEAPTGQVDAVRYTVIGDSHQRLYGLQTEQIHLFDAVSPAILRPLVQSGTQVLQRDPMAVLYLGFNHAEASLSSLLVRQAAAHAIDRNRLIDELFLAGTILAHQFVPPALLAQAPGLHTYNYDPELARRMLRASSYRREPIEFWYPTGSDRPYLTEPEQVYALIAENLAQAGFRITHRPIRWSEGYLAEVKKPSTVRGFHLGGGTTPTRDPLRILGSWFHPRSEEFGWHNSRVATDLAAVRSEADEEQRQNLFQRISVSAALDLPGLPLAFPITGLAVGPRIQYYQISPVLDEQIDHVSLAPQS